MGPPLVFSLAFAGPEQPEGEGPEESEDTTGERLEEVAERPVEDQEGRAEGASYPALPRPRD